MRRSLTLFCLGLILAWHPPAIAEDAPVVSLPPLMVEEKGAPLTWRYLTSPGLEVLSICDDDTLVAFVERYHRLKELLSVIVPQRFLAVRSAPELHLLFNEKIGRARSQEVIAEMLKRETGATRLPPRLELSRGRSANGQAPIIRFLPNLLLRDFDLVSVFAILEDASDTASGFTFASDRIAFLLQGRAPALPDWFVAGTTGLFAQLRFDQDEIEVVQAIWKTASAEATALSQDPGAPRTLLPMEELFSRFAPADAAASTEVDKIWAAQATLFVRWAVTENKGARKEALWKFVDRLEHEALTENLFREHFGMGFADARDRLSDYLPTALQTKLKLPGPKPVRLPRLKVRLATDSEIARIRGAWERMEISYVRALFPDLVEKYVEQARRTLLRAYDKNDRDPRLLAELGLTEIEAGRPADARNYLEAAVAGKVDRARAYYELAVLRFRELPTDPTVKITRQQASSVLTPLLETRRFSLPIPEAYLLFNEIVRRSDESPSAEKLAVMDEGARLFPRVSLLVGRAISMNLAAGNIDTALVQAETGRRAARDPAMQQYLDHTYAEILSKKKE